MKENILALAGAFVGGLAGFFAFQWLLEQNLYGLVVPGGFLGLGAGFGKNRSIGVAAVCGISAVALGIFAEAHFRPFIKDASFRYFITHLTDLRPMTLLMIALGGIIGFWIPFRRFEPRPSKSQTP